MTITQYIQTGPTRANELFARLAETGPGAVKTREKVFAELKEELELHARLEKEHLVPAMKKHDETKGLVSGLAGDSRQVAALLAELDKAPKEGDDFLKQVAELKRTFQKHVRDDRKELLPAVKKALTKAEADAVAAAIEAEKAAIETAKQLEIETRKAQEKLTREAAEAQRAIAAETVAAAAKTAKAGADIGRQYADGAQKAMRSAMETMTRAGGGSTLGLDLSTRQMGQAAEQAAQGMAAMADCSAAVTEAVQESAQAWMAWAQGAAAANVSGFQAMLACRSAPEMAAIQSRVMQEQLSLMMGQGRRISDAAARTTAKVGQAVAARAS